jgi:DNA replication protein DnaC
MKRVGEALAGQAKPRVISAAAPAGVRADGEAGVCPICKGAGWLRASVPFGHPSFGRLFQCECLMNRVDERRRDELLRYSTLDAFRERTFETFDAKLPGVDRAFEAARRFARDPQGWLTLIGTFGCGKTHLAAAIANEALRSGHPVLFKIVPDLLDHLRATFSPTSNVEYDELFERVRTAGLLILDDLGTESATPWAREKLYQIINYRYNYRQPTVITTNRRLAEIDDRIRSRMADAEFCTVIEMTAEDFRPRRGGERRRSAVPRGRGPG